MNRSLSSRQVKKQNFFTRILQKWSPGFHLCSFQQAAVSSRRQTVQLVLTPLVIVVMDKLLNSSHELLIGFEMVEVVHLTFQDAPEALHRAIVNTSTNTGHTLLHSLLVQFRLELWNSSCQKRVCISRELRIFWIINFKGSNIAGVLRVGAANLFFCNLPGYRSDNTGWKIGCSGNLGGKAVKFDCAIRSYSA